MPRVKLLVLSSLVGAQILTASALPAQAAGRIKEFPTPTPNSSPWGIALGPDRNLWFTEGANNIGRVTTSGVFTEFPIPSSGSNPQGIATGPDGNLWFAENGGNKIGRVTTSGTFNEVPIPTTGSVPYGITPVPYGNMA